MTRFLTILGTITLGLLGLILFAVLSFFITMPNVEKLRGCLTTVMYKVSLCDSASNYVSLDKISPFIVGAVIMSEDASFFSHDGIDMNEIKESFIKNMDQGRFARGGSTITQQLAKNVFTNGEKSIFRKLQEVYLARQMEKTYTKNFILTSYLNVVEFGPGIYGIKNATLYYFKKEPSQVTPEEAAFLAFLLPNPKKYSQSFDKKQLTPFASKSIKNILHKMYLGKKISEGEYAVAKSNVNPMFGGSGVHLKAENEPLETETIHDSPSDEPQDDLDFKLEQEPEEL